ncbi:hypothetical protein NFI96_032424 [Prochilodus magdalenae]|nr:hypothetical protein NFI96_032424 [Prochilodus magdalenae]
MYLISVLKESKGGGCWKTYFCGKVQKRIYVEFFGSGTAACFFQAEKMDPHSSGLKWLSRDREESVHTPCSVQVSYSQDGSGETVSVYWFRTRIRRIPIQESFYTHGKNRSDQCKRQL